MIFLARMTAHENENMASRFPESLSEAQILDINEQAIPKVTKFGFGVFQGKLLFLKKYYSTSQFHKRSRNCNANTKQLSTSEFISKFQNTA